MEEEIKAYKYAEIIGYEDYLIYENGQVFSKKSKMFLKPWLNRGYLAIEVCKMGKQKTMKIHRLIALHFIPNPTNKPHVDHIDGNILNNSITNLRWATLGENAQNRKRPPNNTSGVKNVSWNKRERKWKVHFSVNGKHKLFGSFKEFDDAVTFAALKRQELHGEFSRHN